MRKVIHSNFELDLSIFKITDTSENPIFSDQFSAKYSFPIEIDITDDIDKAFGFISFHNANEALTYINVKYVHNNELSDAVLEVQEVAQKLNVLISWGFEEFPNWNKKLSELPLDKFDVTNIYDHCLTIVNQTWPNVNYNFPQIHTDEFDTEDLTWFAFQNIMNHMVAGVFPDNYVDDVENIIYNRNIIQPLPYLLYLLKVGFEDAGKTISGDFLENELVKKCCVFSPNYSFLVNELEYFNLTVVANEYYEEFYNHQIKCFKEIVVSDIAGNYAIVGKVTRRTSFNDSYLEIKVNGNIVWSLYTQAGYNGNGGGTVHEHDIQILISLPAGLNKVSFYTNQGEQYYMDREVCNIDINTINPLGGAGEDIPTIYNENKVDLTRVVADITFGELITTCKNWFNINFDYQTSNVDINFIQDIVINAATKDLSNTEIKYPVRKYNKGNSFLLKFKDVDSEIYKFLPRFHSFETITSENYTVDEKTSPIEINGLPLPLMDRNGSKTAHAFENDTSKLYLVIYDGLTSGKNIAKDPNDLLIPRIHEVFWQKWFNRRLNAVNYLWTYIADSIELINFNVYNKVHAYKNIHLIKNIQKTEVKPDLFEVEIETEAEV
ncbi:hypothetical protein [uncultured Flavobacterium sp.]|uniref:hypothetical protein n=1 Tax=uncultured Flavobacterium sp. TaxID=165435 RepID=UPI0030ED6059